MNYIITQIEKNKEVFTSILVGQTEDVYRFKPTPTAWSILEVLCHLIDEEREDFRQRVFYTLEKPGEAPPSIDPQGWVQSKNYQGQQYAEKVEEFLSERQNSIDYLKNLKAPQWDQFYNHPTMGPLTAEHFLTNWLAHDYIHIRQINRNHYYYLKSITDNDCAYAGNWL